MTGATALLGVLALLIRLIGAASASVSTRLPGWIVARILSVFAIWVGCLALGIFAPAWVVIAPGLLAVAFISRDSPFWTRSLVDVTVVLLSVASAVPDVSFHGAVFSLVLLVVFGATLDSVTQNWPQRTWAVGLAIILVGFTAASLVFPALPRAVQRVALGRVVPMTSGFARPGPEEGVSPRVLSQDPRVPKSIPLGNQEVTTTGSQWYPFLEWEMDNPSFRGNPFDVDGFATFVHDTSGETRRTPLFYDGGGIWKFRFTGTKAGVWRFSTSSPDPELDGRKGVVEISPNPTSPGFVTNLQGKWGRSGSNQTFVPQLVMLPHPPLFFDQEQLIDDWIDEFFEGHGFNGFHVEVFCRWFDLDSLRCSSIHMPDPNPDPRTFLALESLIVRTYLAGGTVHLWAWGDDSRGENPKRWGLNGPQDQRLQKYIAARLGPIPGWTMGYGYDLFEWVESEELAIWERFMDGHLGWPHLLGARSQTNQLTQIAESLDYSSYEQHQPTYEDYVAAILKRPAKPTLSEDRFRVRDEGRTKDYTLDQVRRGLWRSTMAGGVGNIWGYLLDGGSHGAGSRPFPNREEIKTYSRFFEGRFSGTLERCSTPGGRPCLEDPTTQERLLYLEDSEIVTANVPGGGGAFQIWAVDTRQPYSELDLGTAEQGPWSWGAPTRSDWALSFERVNGG